ncbi:MAG: plasmid mobilization protein [Microbacteriaceae bacterium]
MNEKLSEEELIKLIDDETERSELLKDFPFNDLYTIEQRGNRTKVLSVRFSEEEFARLVAASENTGIPVSGLARQLIIDGLTENPEKTDLKSIATMLESVSKQLLAAANTKQPDAA